MASTAVALGDPLGHSTIQPKRGNGASKAPPRRRGSLFVRDLAQVSTPLTPAERARLMDDARRLELVHLLRRRNRPPQRAYGARAGTHQRCVRIGILGPTGLEVLRALLYRFANERTGICCPSYETIAKAARLSRRAVSEALRRLRRAGILSWARRLIRRREVARTSPFTGRPEVIVTCTQGSNVYRFARAIPRAADDRDPMFRWCTPPWQRMFEQADAEWIDVASVREPRD